MDQCIATAKKIDQSTPFQKKIAVKDFLAITHAYYKILDVYRWLPPVDDFPLESLKPVGFLRQFLRLCLKRNDSSRKPISIRSTTICGPIRYGESLPCFCVCVSGLCLFLGIVFGRCSQKRVTCRFCHDLEVVLRVYIGDNWGDGKMLVPP